MTGRKSNRAPVAPTTTPPAAPAIYPVSLDGPMAFNSCIGAPMAIMNPGASIADMLSWAFGQLEQVEILLKVIADVKDFGSQHDPAEMAQAVQHFISPVCSVLHEAGARAFKIEQAAGDQGRAAA